MLIGTTNEPWNSNVKQMKKIYERILMVPGTDYGSTFLTWRTGLLDLQGVDRLKDFSALSSVTKYFGTTKILDVIRNEVDINRRVRYENSPLLIMYPRLDTISC